MIGFLFSFFFTTYCFIKAVNSMKSAHGFCFVSIYCLLLPYSSQIIFIFVFVEYSTASQFLLAPMAGESAQSTSQT